MPEKVPCIENTEMKSPAKTPALRGFKFSKQKQKVKH